jgi:hypothetical protein
MPRIDDYRQALELGKKALLKKDPDLVSRLSGAQLHTDPQGHKNISLSFLTRTIIITWPELEFSVKDSHDEVPIQQQILLLHYLDGVGSGTKLSEDWIAFQDVPDGRFYLGAFLKRAKDPLVKAFGQNPKLLIKGATKIYDTIPYDHGDFSVVVKALPLVPVAIILWKGDEEFPPEGNILFDRTISDIFSAEDIAWLSGMVVYPLIGMAQGKG